MYLTVVSMGNSPEEVMIRVTIELDQDYEELDLTEDELINLIEDVFARGEVKESMAAEVIDLNWD